MSCLAFNCPIYSCPGIYGLGRGLPEYLSTREGGTPRCWTDSANADDYGETRQDKIKTGPRQDIKKTKDKKTKDKRQKTKRQKDKRQKTKDKRQKDKKTKDKRQKKTKTEDKRKKTKDKHKTRKRNDKHNQNDKYK